MIRVSQQIGWSQESKLLYNVLRQFNRLTGVVGKNIPPTTTTTTTCAPIPPINTVMLFDFSQTGSYANGSATVADLSGNGYDAIPVEGTYAGNPELLGPPGYNYNSGLGVMQAVYGHSLRLTNDAFFDGLAPYTFSAWIKPDGTTIGYQGIVSCGGAGSGYTFSYFFDGANYGLFNYRWDTNGNPVATALLFGSNGVPAFVPNKWYFVVGGFDGTNLYISLYDGVHRYDATALGNVAIDSATVGIPPMIGLRWNQWYVGDYGYVQIQDNWGGCGNTNNIFNATKATYGY